MPKLPKPITWRAMGDALIEAGIIRAEDHVRRIVIDINVGHAVIMHVERLGDERLLSVAQGLEGIEIRREDRKLVSKVPETESRGGDKPDWAGVVAGEPLPERGEEYPEPDNDQGTPVKFRPVTDAEEAENNW